MHVPIMSYHKMNVDNNWIDFIKQTADDYGWHYSALSNNLNITWEIVSANQHKEWNTYHLSRNPMTKHPFFQTGQLSYILK